MSDSLKNGRIFSAEAILKYLAVKTRRGQSPPSHAEVFNAVSERLNYRKKSAKYRLSNTAKTGNTEFWRYGLNPKQRAEIDKELKGEKPVNMSYRCECLIHSQTRDRPGRGHLLDYKFNFGIGEDDTHGK